MNVTDVLESLKKTKPGNFLTFKSGGSSIVLTPADLVSFERILNEIESKGVIGTTLYTNKQETDYHILTTGTSYTPTFGGKRP